MLCIILKELNFPLTRDACVSFHLVWKKETRCFVLGVFLGGVNSQTAKLNIKQRLYNLQIKLPANPQIKLKHFKHFETTEI